MPRRLIITHPLQSNEVEVCVVEEMLTDHSLVYNVECRTAIGGYYLVMTHAVGLVAAMDCAAAIRQACLDAAR